jgi:hypothetical protein
VSENDIRVDELEGITAWVEGFVMQPLWLLRTIEHVTDAQFSVAHGLSVGAHRIPPGKAWQSEAVVFNPSVLALMEKIHFEVHPDYENLLTGHAASRPARIEVRARGQSWVMEKRFPHGSPSTDPSTTMSNQELVAKFAGNAEGVIPKTQIEAATEQVMTLETVKDLRELVASLVP